jgi:glycosyltransferase involved in cell wall biosynthesis
MTVRRSIVVPCYNERENLPALLQRFEETGRDETAWELILVDNGSTDGSREVFDAELARPGREFARVVRVGPPNVGYGHGIMTGLRAAKGDRLAWTHADGQTPPADVFRAFAALDASPDPERTLVKGRRRHRPLGDRAFTLGMSAAATVLLREPLHDINAQPKAFPRALLDLAVAPPDDLSLDLYFVWLAHARGFDVRTIDVSFGARERGESKWAATWKSKQRHVARSLRYMARLAREPR